MSLKYANKIKIRSGRLILRILLNLALFVAVLTSPVLVTANMVDLTVSSKIPAANAVDVAQSANITVQFSTTVNGATVSESTFIVDGSMSGNVSGTYSGGGTANITFNPASDFKVGETVTVILTTGIWSVGGSQLTNPVIWQFVVEASQGYIGFHISNDFGTGMSTRSVAFGDVDGDGDLDIAMGNSWEQNMVCLNDGDGTFDTTNNNFGTGSDGTESVVLGDVDGDGDLDIVTGNRNEHEEPGQQNVIYLNDGDGTFDTTSNNFGTGSDQTYIVALGDVDGDGDLDIVAGNWNEYEDLGQQNVVYLNDGDGTFDTTSHNFGTGSDITQALALGDVDGDGDLDIIAGNDGQNVVYLNDGDGTFDTTSHNFGSAGDRTLSLALGDLDSDGDLDIATAVFGTDRIYLNDGDGTFDTTSRTLGSLSGPTYGAALGDVDGDGDLDIAIGMWHWLNAIYINNGDATFATGGGMDQEDNTYYYLLMADPVTLSVALGDVDGDGDLDIAAGNGGQSVVHLNVPPVPEMRVEGNTDDFNYTEIADGDNTPSLVDYTDFGIADVDSGTVARSFTISNIASLDLNLTGAPIVEIGGTHAADFTVTILPTSTISPLGEGDELTDTVAAWGGATFEVTFDPSALGLRTATLSIANDDADENPYNFDIQGTGVTGVTVYDLTDSTNNTAYYNEDSGTDTPQIPGSPGYVEYSTGEHGQYYNVNANDQQGNDWEPTGFVNLLYRFEISEPYSSISQIKIIWIGYDDLAEGDDFELDTWNSTGSAWEQWYTTTTGQTSEQVYTQSYTSNLANYIDGSEYFYVGISGGYSISGEGDTLYDNYISLEVTVTLAPEMNVEGNSVEITDGDSTPSLADHTDFGDADIDSGTVVRTFTVENDGFLELNLSGTTKVEVGGTHAADFAVTTQPTTPVATSGSTTFQVTFDPSATGLRTATLSIANDDADENPYDFTIQGTGIIPAPEMSVEGNSIVIADEDTSPSLSDHTNFGTANVTTGTVVRTFTIKNTGSADLNLTGTPIVEVGGTHASDFTVTAQPTTPVTASGNTSFQVTFDPSTTDLRLATLSIDNDDSDENPYNFSIKGIGAEMENVKSETTGSGTVTVDAKDEADTDVVKSGSGTPIVTIVEYVSNPGGTAPGGFTSLGKYIDVNIDDATGVDEIEIRNYYTSAEITGLDEASLTLAWWDGSAWVECSDSGATPIVDPAYKGYVWAKIRTDTTPTLTDMGGTPFIPMGTPPAPPAEEGGGGGGGISPPPGTSHVYDAVTSGGEFTEDVSTESEDGSVELDIEEGTVGLDEHGRSLVYIEINEMEDPPDPPKESNRIGLTYDLEPDGATFDPPISLTFHYDPDEIPEGVSEENLVIAMWDEEAGEWVDLPCTVDPETNTITASVSHFTAFSVVAFTHPAAFETSYLTILPSEVEPDEKVTIGVKVTNTGSLSDSYEVTLKIDNVVVDTEDVALEGSASQKVTFATSKDVAGTYNVNVDGLSGTFTVKPAPAVAPPAPLAPAPPAPLAPPAPPVAQPNWGLIGGIIAGCIVVGLLVYFFVRRKRGILRLS